MTLCCGWHAAWSQSIQLGIQNRTLCHYLDLPLLFWWFCICLLHWNWGELGLDWIWRPGSIGKLAESHIGYTCGHNHCAVNRSWGKNLGDPQGVSRKPRNPLKPPMPCTGYVWISLIPRLSILFWEPGTHWLHMRAFSQHSWEIVICQYIPRFTDPAHVIENEAVS